MAAVQEDDSSRDNTNPGMDLQQAMFDELRSISKAVKDIGERMEQMERKFGQVVTDIHTIHQLQRTYTSRLTVIEQMCVDAPLKTSPPPSSGNAGSGKVD